MVSDTSGGVSAVNATAAGAGRSVPSAVTVNAPGAGVEAVSSGPVNATSSVRPSSAMCAAAGIGARPSAWEVSAVIGAEAVSYPTERTSMSHRRLSPMPSIT